MLYENADFLNAMFLAFFAGLIWAVFREMNPLAKGRQVVLIPILASLVLFGMGYV